MKGGQIPNERLTEQDTRRSPSLILSFVFLHVARLVGAYPIVGGGVAISRCFGCLGCLGCLGLVHESGGQIPNESIRRAQDGWFPEIPPH